MGSWGRHGWPRSNEGARIYRERNGAYCMVFPEEREIGGYSAIGNVMTYPEPPSLAGCTVSRDYLLNSGCKRVQWSEIPEHWQKAFLWYLRDDGTDAEPWRPENERGLWLMGSQPKAAETT